MEMKYLQVGLFLLAVVVGGAQSRFIDENPILMPQFPDFDDIKETIENPTLMIPQAQVRDVDDIKVTRWALLVAGSLGYGNYRHQADVCHAYQMLKRNGLKDENIVVMMFDDIANHTDNPRQGSIINHPQGSDVYAGVPKDYTGSAVSASNLYAVLLGDRNATVGGNGKVIDSGPEDHIFIFYSDHGGPGVLGMPGVPYVYANDFVETLKKKHASGSFKEMVIYLEACESGSIFEGLLPEGLNIYVTTASGPEENSWGTYCPGTVPPPPPEFDTCIGDLYSVAWMEDSEVNNLKRETLRDQYLTVKDRTSNHNTYQAGSHVMEYGDVQLNAHRLSLFFGFDPANVDTVPRKNDLSPVYPASTVNPAASNAVDQRDADLVHLWHKYSKAKHGREKREARRKMTNVLRHRNHVDDTVQLIGESLFGADRADAVLGKIRAPLVDNWSCLKTLVHEYESRCGLLGQYGMKHMRVFANICNADVELAQFKSAVEDACVSV